MPSFNLNTPSSPGDLDRPSPEQEINCCKHTSLHLFLPESLECHEEGEEGRGECQGGVDEVLGEVQGLGEDDCGMSCVSGSCFMTVEVGAGGC